MDLCSSLRAKYPFTESLKPGFGLGYVATALVDECHLPFAITAERTVTKLDYRVIQPQNRGIDVSSAW